MSKQGKAPIIHHAMMVLWNCIQEADALDSSTMKNSVTDLMILKHFKIANRLGRAPAIIEVQWKAPLTGCFSKPLGIIYAFEAELLGIITAVEFAQKFNWSRLWFECDSTYVVELLRNRSKSIP
ncbi:hypothetical protein TIFTF001_009767 [Ficus carica]|uniref:RNase H type-1 domain-containing protein n=1 Tax=Ficus carica TaxID=3494 RepID=A0AA88D3W4_FICCA|nr:hypothetical protein TIFTF001_009767 [Ficus carica]